MIRKVTKSNRISDRYADVSLEDLKAQAAKQEVQNLERIIADPRTDPRTRYEAEQRLPQARAENGLNPDTGAPDEGFRIRSLSNDDLMAEYRAAKEVRDAEALEQRQLQAAIDFVASESRYKATIANRVKMENEIKRRGLTAENITDFQTVFEDLARTGQLELAEHYLRPRRVYSREELSQMSAAEMKQALIEMGTPEQSGAVPSPGVSPYGLR